MASNKNSQFKKSNTSNINNDFTPRSSDNHSYINLSEEQEAKKILNINDMNKKPTHNSPMQPLTIDNVNRLSSQKPYNELQYTSTQKAPKKWYSPPNSVQSDSRPPSFAGTRPSNHKELPKLQTIDENNVILSINKIISLCSNDDGEIQLNALAYLQHLIFNNNEKKLEVRNCNGLRILIDITKSTKIQISILALAVLKNLSFTEMEMITNDIERLGGIQRMTSIIKSSKDIIQKELATDILWNLSVHYELKNVIYSETVKILLEYIILPESKLVKEKIGNYVCTSEDINWSILLRNALGIIRNISYEGSETRIKLRQEDGLIDCIMNLISMSKNDQENESDQISLIDSKIIEHCICILRNLTYAIQEVVDPNYLKTRTTLESKPKISVKGKNHSNNQKNICPAITEVPKGIEFLWNAKLIVSILFPILKYCANAVTLEAAAGVIQNQSAGDWEPSKEIQVQFRLQLALPILVELIDVGPDEVIRSAATALRNLVREENTRMLIGTNGLRTITERVPSHSRSRNINNIALAALLSTIYAIIKHNDEFMKEFILAKGAQRCIYIRNCDEFINKDDERPDKIQQFCKFILDLLWKTPAARELLKNNNYKKSDIVQTRNLDPCNLCTHSKTSKPIQLYEESNYQDSADNNKFSDLPPQYHDDHRMLRDSRSTIISNSGLEQRNSKAFKTNDIPGYGQVKVPVIHKRNNPEDNILPQNGIERHPKSVEPNVDNRKSNLSKYQINAQNNAPHKQPSRHPIDSDYSFSNKSYQKQDECNSNNLKTKNINQLENTQPAKSYKTTNVKEKSKKGDSWV